MLEAMAQTPCAISTHEQGNMAKIQTLYETRSDKTRALFVMRKSMIGLFERPGGDYSLSTRPIEEWVPCLAEGFAAQADLRARVRDDGVTCASMHTGTQLFAYALGAEAHVFSDTNPCALACFSSGADAMKMKEPDFWSARGVSRVFELGAALQKALGKDVVLAPSDLQSGFDTAALMWDKTDFLCALADEDEHPAVDHLVGICARFFKQFMLELRKAFPTLSPCHCPETWTPPSMGPWLSNDECGAMSVAMFERFALPELLELSETFGGLGMHCCADAEHVFPSFNKIPNFYGFNRVAAKHGYDPILEHFGGPDGPVHVLMWLKEDVVQHLLEHAPEGTRFIFNQMVNDEDEARRWLERFDAWRWRG